MNGKSRVRTALAAVGALGCMAAIGSPAWGQPEGDEVPFSVGGFTFTAESQPVMIGEELFETGPLTMRQTGISTSAIISDPSADRGTMRLSLEGGDVVAAARWPG